MTDKDKLIAACVRTPEDNLPRLALADWLRENGEQGAGDFIQWQVEHPESREGCYGDHSVGQMCSTESGECPTCQVMNALNVPYIFRGEDGYLARRGFLAEVTCNASTWERWGPELVKVAPVELVRIKDIRVVPMALIGGGEVWVFDSESLHWWFREELQKSYYFHQDFPFKTRELGEEYITRVCLGYTRSKLTALTPAGRL